MWSATAKLNPDQEFVLRQSSLTEWVQQVWERGEPPTPEPHQVNGQLLSGAVRERATVVEIRKRRAPLAQRKSDARRSRLWHLTSVTHQRSSELTQVESASGLGHDCSHDFWIADVQSARQLEGVGDDLERSISIERSWLATEIVQSLCASLFEQILGFEYVVGGTLCGQRLLSDAVKEIVTFAPARTIRGDSRQFVECAAIGTMRFEHCD